MNAIRDYWNRSPAARFVVVGGACAILYFAICLFLSDMAGFSPFYASMGAYLVCFFIGYSSQREIAFRSTTSHRITLTRYFVWHVFGATSVSFATNFATGSFELKPLFIALVSTALCGVVSFCISYGWIFRNS